MPKSHYLRARYILTFCLFLSSCASGQQISNLITPTTSPTPKLWDTLQPHQSPTSPAVEITPTASVATLDDQKLKDIVFSPCVAVNPEPPGGNQIPWLLVVERAAVYTIDPNSGLKSAQLIPPPSPKSPLVYDFALSPDGKWIAYVLSDENDDVVVEPSINLLTKSSEGRIVWRPENPFQIQGWLSNESVVITVLRDPDRFVSTLIRNPFKEEEHEFFIEKLPDYLYYQPGGLQGTMLFANSNLMPDPTLKRVVYPAINADRYYQAALWDVENKKVLASLRILWDWVYDNDPLWSLDGSDFLIMGLDEKVNTREWFQVTRDGTITQLTHFGESLKDDYIARPSRSPDGRYLAFKLLYNRKEDGTLSDGKYFILDLKSPSLDVFCIDSGGKSNPDKPFAWSPDNKYLTITNGDIVYGDAVVILVDLDKRKAFQIGNDVHAIGWMVKP